MIFVMPERCRTTTHTTIAMNLFGDLHMTTTLKILRDQDPQHPRKDFSNLGVMACWHKRASHGDVQPKQSGPEWLEENAPEGSVVLPIHAYEHSGMVLSTSNAHYPFNCRFDSGQLGVLVATPEAIKECFMVDTITEEIREKAEKALKVEIEVYNLYLSGAVWGFVFKKTLCHHPRHETPCDPDCEVCQHECGPANYKTEEDSCWGFYGDSLEDTGLADQVPDEAKPLLEAAWEART
jgi:hypothetical protein